MKNILVAAIFLFSQLGMTAEKANQVKKFEIENLTFSQLLLTKEEIIHLNQKDQATYVFGMIALAQIIEGSQRYHMGYEDTVVTAQQENLKEAISAKYANLFAVLFPQANAFVIPLIVGALEVTAGALARSAAWVAARAAIPAAREGLKKGAQMAFEFVPSKATLASMTSKVAESSQKFKAAQEAMFKALKKSPGKTDLKEVAAFTEAKTALEAEKAAFTTGGGTTAQLEKAIAGSGLKRIFSLGNLKDMAVSSLAFYGADTMLKDATGFSPMDSITKLAISGFTSVKDWITGTDISGPGMVTPEQIKALKAGDSSRAIGKTCIFGAIPSMWIDKGGAGPVCTRPAEASNENCKKEDGKFQCPNHGFKLVSGTIDASLCIDTVKTDNLTVRCSNTLRAILEAKAATLDSTEAATGLQKNFGEVLKGLEARDRMKNDKGETKSIFEYCMADNVEQKEECGAIKEVLGLLKTTDVKKIYETRVQLAQVEPAAAKPAAPAGSTPADDASAAGVKQ